MSGYAWYHTPPLTKTKKLPTKAKKLSAIIRRAVWCADHGGKKKTKKDVVDVEVPMGERYALGSWLGEELT